MKEKKVRKKIKVSNDVIKTTDKSINEVVRLKVTKMDYIITFILVLLIILAIGFIIWTRKGYMDNFTEQFGFVSDFVKV